jgi:hypothetical protein
MSEDMSQERVCLANRVRQQLQRYYPQMLQVRDDIAMRPLSPVRRGHSHGRALRTIGDRLLALTCAMRRSQTTYDPQRVGPRR